MNDKRTSPFELIDPSAPSAADGDHRQRLAALDARELPIVRSLEQTAGSYHATPELVDAINVALALGVPLLLTGEPGTGKTQVAYYAARYFGTALHPVFVNSTTTTDDLFYSFDAVAYLHAAHESRSGGVTDNDGHGERLRTVKKNLIHRGKGALWHAFESDKTVVVLIDEIDKASRDFPNDLLNAIDQLHFQVRELDPPVTIRCNKPPFIVITSNLERRLPDPFLRRCVVHNIELTPELARDAVAAHVGSFPNLSDEVHRAAIRRFFDLRLLRLRKRPAIAELLAWLTVLSARGNVDADTLAASPVAELPALITLIKDHDDHQQLRAGRPG